MRPSLEALRFVADDAVAHRPVMPRRAQRIDVKERGDELTKHLRAARRALDALVKAVRAGRRGA
jgi:hypothetical protein